MKQKHTTDVLLTSPVSYLVRKLSHYRQLALRSTVRSVFVLLLFSFSVGRAEAAVYQAPVSRAERGPQIAVADFDRDGAPDIVSLTPAQDVSTSVDYVIDLRLSTRGRKLIHLLGRAGGLLMEARDINGDNAVDLVLFSAWPRQPVGLFLNDGHGGFSWAEPDAFPQAFNQPDNTWGSTPNHEIGGAVAASSTRDGISNQTGRLSSDLSSFGSAPASHSRLFSKSYLTSQAERAPPCAVPFS